MLLSYLPSGDVVGQALKHYRKSSSKKSGASNSQSQQFEPEALRSLLYYIRCPDGEESSTEDSHVVPSSVHVSHQRYF